MPSFNSPVIFDDRFANNWQICTKYVDPAERCYAETKWVHETCTNWLNITITVQVIFQKIFALIRVRHIVSSKRVIVQKNVIFSNIQRQIICDILISFQKWNSHANSINISHLTTNNPFLSCWYLVYKIRELFTPECHNLYIEIHSNYIPVKTTVWNVYHFLSFYTLF